MNHSIVDKLFYQIWGFYPKKAGTAQELLTAAVLFIEGMDDVRYNHFMKSPHCDTTYQLDALVETDKGSHMVEAKDYTIQNSKVERKEVQKLEGALIDLENINKGIFSSATGYTKGAQEYAKGTQKNKRAVPIDLYEVRPSKPEDGENRIKTIQLNFTSVFPDFTHGTYNPIFSTKGIEMLKKNHLLGEHIPLRLENFYDADGNVRKTLEELTKSLNDQVSLKNMDQTQLQGEFDLDGLYIPINNTLYPLRILKYTIPVVRFTISDQISDSGHPVLLIKSLDGKTDKLITLEKLKQISFSKEGTVEWKDE